MAPWPMKIPYLPAPSSNVVSGRFPAPSVPPLFLQMAAAMMHSEGRLFEGPREAFGATPRDTFSERFKGETPTKPLSFAERAKPVEDAVASGHLDPAGMNATTFRRA